MSQDAPRPVERLYLDFDSFFASAEQHFNPSLRGRPVGVVPLDAPNTGLIAMSREAKARGLKGMVSLKEARAQVPDLVAVVARHDVYVRLHNRIVDVVNGCVPVSDVRSIDEMVCALTPAEAAEGEALGHRIKTALRDAFSDVLTCSIGMAPTELLAKIGAEMNKPDGFALLENAQLPGAISHLRLTKLPGISNGIAARLDAAGVGTVPALWRLERKQARAIWGNVEGERFWAGFHGYASERPATQKRMFGHSRMLPSDWRGPQKIAVCARELTLSAARRLRRTEFRAGRMTVSFRGGGYRRPDGQRTPVQRWSTERSFTGARDDRTFLAVLHNALEEAGRTRTFVPRSVTVMLHGLEDTTTVTGDLFDAAAPEHEKRARDRWETVSDVMDRLRAQHGPAAISLGPRGEVPGGYLGGKIAFGRIPNAADFSAPPVPDEATHFCTY